MLKRVSQSPWVIDIKKGYCTAPFSLLISSFSHWKAKQVDFKTLLPKPVCLKMQTCDLIFQGLNVCLITQTDQLVSLSVKVIIIYMKNFLSSDWLR